MSCPHDENDIIEDPVSGRVCTQCGLVLDGTVFESSPHNFRYEEPQSHSRQPMQRAERSLYHTERDTETGVTAFKTSASRKAVGNVCSTLRLVENVRKTAEDMHLWCIRAKEATGGFRGPHFHASAASAVYYACMFHGVSRGEVEFDANLLLSRSRLTTMNKTIRRLLAGSPYAHRLQQPIDPRHLIPRFVATLCLAPCIIPKENATQLRSAMERILSDDAIMTRLEGRTPECTCAAAAVKGIEDHLRVQCDRKEISYRCGVSPASINAIVKKM